MHTKCSKRSNRIYEESESTQISLELKWDRLFQIYFGLSFTTSPEGIQALRLSATLFCGSQLHGILTKSARGSCSSSPLSLHLLYLYFHVVRYKSHPAGCQDRGPWFKSRHGDRLIWGFSLFSSVATDKFRHTLNEATTVSFYILSNSSFILSSDAT
jgi:hypothetical protein